MLPVFLAAVVVFALAVLGLGLGILFRWRGLHAGCCGTGEHVIGPDGKEITCDTCPNRDQPEA